jgi:hypothetical protein
MEYRGSPVGFCRPEIERGFCFEMAEVAVVVLYLEVQEKRKLRKWWKKKDW